MVQGCHHNTLALTITESMGSQWVARLTTLPLCDVD